MSVVIQTRRVSVSDYYHRHAIYFQNKGILVQLDELDNWDKIIRG